MRKHIASIVAAVLSSFRARHEARKRKEIGRAHV